MSAAYGIIDVHTHIVRRLGEGFTRNGEQESLGGGRVRYADGTEAVLLPEGKESFSPEDLVELMDKNGVEKAVLLQGPTLGFCNAYTYEAQQRYPGRLYGVGIFDPYCAYADRIMRRLHEEFHFLGYKFEISCAYGLVGFHPGYRVTDAIMTPVYDYCRRNDLKISFDMATFGQPSMQAKELAEVAARYPDVKFVLEHCFYPASGLERVFAEAMRCLQPCENVYVTTASIPHATRPDPYPYPKANRYVEIACEILGHQRVMWGTDVPQVLLPFSYRELAGHLTDAGLFSEGELRDIYRENARRFYGFDR